MYRFRPWRKWWRLLRIVLTFVGLFLGLKLDEAMGKGEGNQQERAEQLRKILTDLGPTYIKVGQALSTRPDLVRQDYLDELIKLQDQLPPFPNEIALQIIEEELDRDPYSVYSEISPHPVAAASLGQVYRATLYTGEEVAIKVQRPNLYPLLTLDLCLMRWAAQKFGHFLPLNLGHDLTLIIDEFGTKLFEEIDYQNEGRNAEKFAANFAGDPEVKVPRIHWEYSGKRVLTLEWIHGYKLTDLEAVQQAGLDSDAIIRIGVTAGLRQLLEHGLFHADPHPGNLFAMVAEPGTDAPGRMAYIDFGMMDQLEPWMKETLVDAVVHLINKDYEELAKDFVNLGFLTPDTDIRPIVPALEAVFDDAIGASVGDFNFKAITDKFSDLMFDYPFRVPAKFALIIRSLVTQEGLALTLNPNFKIVEIAYPYVARRLLTGESPALRRRLLEVLFKDGRFQWQRLENMIAIARSDRKFDLLPTAQLGIQYLVSEEGDFLRRQIVMALTEDNRLHTEEVQRLWALVKDDLQPNRMLTEAWKAIVDFSLDRTTEMFPALATLTGNRNGR
ncbi:AarF/ABC1/UbiB kinase family protein [Alkalinema sp. FACHB-956]|uniref:ABC1 kinase family protein n=1 Tax=Alkalinema sp. FACHB-956 TaxID=2692768 RepID=UPI001F54C5BA|nr:AarF/ABC1/UbiB kinase family protein [Alkalinema sp. FACHB-956]